MLFVRPARLADLDALSQMARAAQPVLHSLPHDREALGARIAASEDAFRANIECPGEESYLFVLEDSGAGEPRRGLQDELPGRLRGTSGIIAAAGYPEPFYAFRNDALIHASRELHVNRTIHALTMSHELTGMSRLAGFYVDPSLRGDAAAHLISRARMMYIAMNRRRFTSQVFSLLLGVTDESGMSPFWEAVGRKFFGRDFRDIEVASGGRSRTFIAEVMPAYPLYVPLLPESAQRVLGVPDPHALLAYAIHRDEGFEPDRYIDIFDAGPVLTAQVDRTASVVGNEMRIVREPASVTDGVAYLVASDGAANRRAPGEFRCVIATLPRRSAHADGPPDAPLDAPTRAALGVQDGDAVHCVLLGSHQHMLPTADDPTGVTP